MAQFQELSRKPEEGGGSFILLIVWVVDSGGSWRSKTPKIERDSSILGVVDIELETPPKLSMTAQFQELSTVVEAQGG